MRVIVAGGRDFADHERLATVLDEFQHDGQRISQLVCGMARGADHIGYDWAVCAGIPIAEFPADWDAHGKLAGFLRNESMAQSADVLIAFWDGVSKGTKHMIDAALRHGLEVHVHRYSK